MTASVPPAPPRAGRREWIGLAVIALPCLLYSMDLTVLNLAVPRLSADLKPSSSQLLWIIDIYGFLIAVNRGHQRRRCAGDSPSGNGAPTKGPGRLPAGGAGRVPPVGHLVDPFRSVRPLLQSLKSTPKTA
jgi:hypothetical protein